MAATDYFVASEVADYLKSLGLVRRLGDADNGKPLCVANTKELQAAGQGPYKDEPIFVALSDEFPEEPTDAPYTFKTLETLDVTVRCLDAYYAAARSLCRDIHQALDDSRGKQIGSIKVSWVDEFLKFKRDRSFPSALGFSFEGSYRVDVRWAELRQG